MSLLGESEGRRRLAIASVVFAGFTLVSCWLAPRSLWARHTPYNHFALLAESWLSGRLDLGAGAPAYAGNNDFAEFEGRTYIVFPPFPALLLLPWVALSGGATPVRDGLFFVLLAGSGPAILFLALEKLRAVADCARSERENLAFALLFGFGTVYLFSAVQGTVWFAAHVVGVALSALYLLFSVRAERPLAAGVALALGFATRSPLIFAAPLFVFEAVRVAAPANAPPLLERPLVYLRGLDRGFLSRCLALFAAPIAVVLALSLWHNAARFGDPLEVGYRYLTVVWQTRIEKWGLFSYHYLARNLGVIMSSLPWVPGERGAPFAINQHGLALWFTTPLYLCLLRPRRTPAPMTALAVTAFSVALPSLFYQNTGWQQFGYRFSNDFAVFVFAMLALSGVRLGRGVWLLAAWSVLVNVFGALSFGRADYARYYFAEPTQRVLYQPD